MVGRVIRHAAGEQIAARQTACLPRLHGQRGDIPVFGTAEDLQSAVDRDNSAFDQADSARVERDEVTAEVQAEVELIGTFEKKGTLLGKEQRELREIDLARV